ncbi:hypothetical protein AVEN_148554-1, partial [Araneus ventricosus]
YQHTSPQYRSASNSLLARTADRTSKIVSKHIRTPRRSTRSKSINIHSLCDPAHSLYSLPGRRNVIRNHLVHSIISSPNRDIEKIPAPLRFHISSPRSGAAASHPILTPVKLSSQP